MRFPVERAQRNMQRDSEHERLAMSDAPSAQSSQSGFGGLGRRFQTSAREVSRSAKIHGSRDQREQKNGTQYAPAFLRLFCFGLRRFHGGSGALSVNGVLFDSSS